MDEREILRIAVRHDIDSYLTEALTLEFVRDVLKAGRRTTPDREAIIEACASIAESTYAKDAFRFELGTEAARAIRALKTAPTTSPRDTLIEEIAEMVDHMGEGRRLEEYVGAIRDMKSGDKGGA